MKLLIPVILKMSHVFPLKKLKISYETLKNDARNENASDIVVNPLTEFHVLSEDKKVDTNDAYDLPNRIRRKTSSTSLYTRVEVDHNELPRVHRTLSNQSLVNILKEKPATWNLLTSNSLDFGSFNNISILPSKYDLNTEKETFDDSTRTCNQGAEIDISKHDKIVLNCLKHDETVSNAVTHQKTALNFVGNNAVDQEISETNSESYRPNELQKEVIETAANALHYNDTGFNALSYNETASNVFRNYNETVHSPSNISRSAGVSVENTSIVLKNHNDSYETASNISISSNITDVPCSLVSSVSDVDENTYKVDKNEIVNELNKKIDSLQSENEKFKFDLNDLEWKTELKWQEKYQNSQREKANIDGQFTVLQYQYENLLKEKEKLMASNNKNALFEEYSKLQTKLNTLEKQNSELNSKFALSINETKQYQLESSKLESENEKLRVAEQELKIELESKNSVLLGLKNKITEQHIEVQNHIQSKLKLQNHLTSLNNEIESVRKSEKWYMEQLHTSQLAKSKLQQQLMSIQSNILSDNQKIESLRTEIIYWKNVNEETKKKAFREKEKLLRKMEMIESDLVEREATYKCTNEGHKIDNVAYNLKKLEDNQNEIYNKLIIEEYEERLDNFNQLITQKDEMIGGLNKEKTDFLIRITTLQKLLNEKEILYQLLENANNDLEMKCDNYTETIRLRDNQLLELRNKIVQLEVALHAASKEKEEIDEVVKNVREDFNKFMKCYNKMKETLEEKTKIINNFECEKQELFMENNWRVCEIEELQQKVLNAKGTQAELLELRNSYNELVMGKEKLADEMKLLNDSERLTLKETLQLREDQLLNQTKNYDLLNNEISGKEKQINDLKLFIKKLEHSCKNESFKTKELRDINIELEMKIKGLNKKLQDSNYVIEQFNDLCKNSEMEKHNLSIELENIRKTNEDTLNMELIGKTLVNKESQTDIIDSERIKSIINDIKIKFEDVLTENNIIDRLDNDKFDFVSIFVTIHNFLDKILNFKQLQEKKIDINDKVIKTLKNKVMILKNIIHDKANIIEKRCNDVLKNYEDTRNKVNVVYRFVKGNKLNTSVEIQTETDNENMCEMNTNNDNKEKKSENTNRMLLRKLKEELRLRKIVEKNFQELQETYNLSLKEINNLKITNNRIEIEYETLKTRCTEYKDKCDKLNKLIISLEKEKGENTVKENLDCEKCSEFKKISDDFYELECKYKTIKDKVYWFEKEITDKEQGIIECKKQVFNEKLQTSALKKQLSSIQMCLDNANGLLDKKQVEFAQLKGICEKLEVSKSNLMIQLETEQNRHEECKRKLEEYTRLIEEQNAKDTLFADEIKMLSCHLHQKNLEISNADNKLHLLEHEHGLKLHSHENTIIELQNSLTEVRMELEGVRNDKFFLQRLCADLKMSLQGTINQNKVLRQRLETLQAETSNISNLSSLSSCDDEYINRLLKESTVHPEWPLLNLRSCLDSLKSEMAILQKEVIAKTRNVSNV